MRSVVVVVVVVVGARHNVTRQPLLVRIICAIIHHSALGHPQCLAWKARVYLIKSAAADTRAITMPLGLPGDFSTNFNASTHTMLLVLSDRVIDVVLAA